MELTGPARENFINSLKTDKTKLEYTKSLIGFAKWKNVKSLDELLVAGDATKLKEDIKKYLRYLEKPEKEGGKQLASSSKKLVAAALKHFFDMNDVLLNWRQISMFLGESTPVHEDREYTHEEIQKLITVSDFKYKAMILLMASSGVRLGALPELKYGDLKKMEKYDIYKVIVYRKSRQHQYYSFCTPEAHHAITEYLDYRKRFGEKITSESPLFRYDFDPESKEQVQCIN